MKYFIDQTKTGNKFDVETDTDVLYMNLSQDELPHVLTDATKVIVLDAQTAETIRRCVKKDTRIIELCSILPFYDSKVEYHLNIPFNNLADILGLSGYVSSVKTMYEAIETGKTNIDMRLDKQISLLLQTHYRKLDSYSDFSTQLKLSTDVDVNGAIKQLSYNTFNYLYNNDRGKLVSMLDDIATDRDEAFALLEVMYKCGTSLENVRHAAMQLKSNFKRYFKLPYTTPYDLNEELLSLLTESGCSPHSLHFGSMCPNTADTLQMSYSDLSRIFKGIANHKDCAKLLGYISPNMITMDRGISDKFVEYSKSRNFTTMKLYTVHRKSITMLVTMLADLDLGVDAIMRSSEK